MKFIYYLFCLLLLTQCTEPTDTTTEQAQNAFSDCKYGSPKAIFAANTPLVTAHQFELGSHAAVETVSFNADIQLELTQSGCEKPKQEFKFTIPGDSKVYSTDDWIDMALNQLDFLGNLHKPLEPLLFWSGALKQKRAEIKLGQPVPLEQGHYVKIDKVSGDKNGILIIEMSQF